MVPEAELDQTDSGLVPASAGWFVLNARDAHWNSRPGRQMYHWETETEAFLVLSGEAVPIVEGEERPLCQWDFVHCPPKTKHVIVGAGDGPPVILDADLAGAGLPESKPTRWRDGCSRAKALT